MSQDSSPDLMLVNQKKKRPCPYNPALMCARVCVWGGGRGGGGRERERERDMEVDIILDEGELP